MTQQFPPGYIHKRNEKVSPHKNSHMNVPSSITHKSQKVIITQIPTELQTYSFTWYNHAMEYYSAIKRNEVLIYAKTQMNPENMLS